MIAPREIDSRYYVDTAARTLALLHAVAESDEPASLGALVSRLEWSKPAVYRLVRTLEAVGALRQQDSKGYVLGPSIITLGQAALRATRLHDIARPYLEELADRVGETIVLTVLDRLEVVYIDRIESDQILIPRTKLGSRLPAHCTATGQALLAGFTDDEVRRMYRGRRLEARTSHTIAGLDELIDRLATTRRRGYALNNEELAVGHRAVAAPLRNHAGEYVAAMSISVPSARVSLEQLERFATEALLPVVDRASVALGAAPQSAEAYGGDRRPS